jgi:hypothetical protein
MKKLISLAIGFIIIGLTQVHSQSLQGTQWKSFFEGSINDTATFSIMQDSSIITNSKGMELVRSIFHVSHDTASINDVTGMIACLDGAGIYKVSNTGNTLTLTLISDPCDGRANSLSGRKWVKVEKR